LELAANHTNIPNAAISKIIVKLSIRRGNVMGVNITSNSITSATSVTIRLRADSANTNLVISAIQNQTGVLSDSTDNYTAATTDAMNYSVVTGATGTSLKISFLSIWGNATPAPGGRGPMYQHFSNVKKLISRQDYNSFGGQMVSFG
jgi:hypothetical protein